MHYKIRFNIITPTILRPSLIRLCESINNQTYYTWNHILIIDYLDKKNINLLENKELYHSNRKILLYHANIKSGYPASEVRAYGLNHIQHLNDNIEYMNYNLYIDDDDYYMEYSLNLLNDFLIDNRFPNWGIFPAKRLGTRFYFPHDMRLGKVMGTQLYHKSNLEVWPIENVECDDWRTIENLFKIDTPINYNCNLELSITDIIGEGK